MEKIAPTNKNILRIFKYRCIMCGQEAHHVHEIVPKSLTKDWYVFENRVPLCISDHQHVHSYGSQNFKEELEQKRIQKLEAFYGEEFISEIERLFT